jgi:hypothetical protein
MALKSIQTGADHTMQLTINDSTGVPVDLDNADNIEVRIYQKRSNILAEYSLSAGTVVIINANTGRANVYVNRSSLNEVPEGKLYAEVTVDIDNNNFTDNVKRTIASSIILGEVKISV